MRKSVISVLSCPNQPGSTQGESVEWQIYATTLQTENGVLKNVPDIDMADTDEIVDGVLLNMTSRIAYPIHRSICILLSDSDADRNHHHKVFDDLSGSCPADIQQIIRETLERIDKINKTSDSVWNNEEMTYYDEAVDSAEKRAAMVQDIQNKPIWHIFIPRKKHMLDHFTAELNGERLLEIGCGNTRTISQILPPKQHHYNYIGTDISFYRLVVAKENMPDGDFFQASAFNLPFKNRSMKGVISFGVLHHLPNPAASVEECSKKLKQGGFFSFHEPIVKKKVISGNLSFLEKYMSDYDHSEHDNEIESENILGQLKQLDYELVAVKYHNSIVRSAMELVLRKISISLFKTKFVVLSIFLIDRMAVNTLCRISSYFGPHGMTLVARKR